MAYYMNYIGLNLVWAVLILYHGFICTVKAQEAIYTKSDTYTEPRNLLFFSYSVSDADCFAICSAMEACSMITIEFLDDQKSYICQHYEVEKDGNEINTLNEMEIWYKTGSSHLSSDPTIDTESSSDPPIETESSSDRPIETESSSDPTIETESHLLASTMSLSSSVQDTVTESTTTGTESETTPQTSYLSDSTLLSWTEAGEYCQQQPGGPDDLAVFATTDVSILRMSTLIGNRNRLYFVCCVKAPFIR